jgi:hypothetical protein
MGFASLMQQRLGDNGLIFPSPRIHGQWLKQYMIGEMAMETRIGKGAVLSHSHCNI